MLIWIILIDFFLLLKTGIIRPDQRRALGPQREKARHARGEGAKPLAALAARRGGKRRAAPGERSPKLQAARPEHGECSPHTATSACSAPPSPQQDWTELENLNKRSPPPACVREVTRHRREGKQEPDKQRESLQKGPVHQVKIPEGNTDYTGRGL